MVSCIFLSYCGAVKIFVIIIAPGFFWVFLIMFFFSTKWAPFHKNTSSSGPENGPIAMENVFYSRHCTSNWFIYAQKAAAKFCWMFHVLSSVLCSLRTWQHYQLSYRCPCWQNKSNCYETGLARRSGMTKNNSLTLRMIVRLKKC